MLRSTRLSLAEYYKEHMNNPLTRFILPTTLGRTHNEKDSGQIGEEIFTRTSGFHMSECTDFQLALTLRFPCDQTSRPAFWRGDDDGTHLETNANDPDLA